MKIRPIDHDTAREQIDCAAWYEHIAARVQPSAVLTQQIRAAHDTLAAPKSRGRVLNLDSWRKRLTSLTRRAA